MRSEGKNKLCNLQSQYLSTPLIDLKYRIYFFIDVLLTSVSIALQDSHEYPLIMTGQNYKKFRVSDVYRSCRSAKLTVKAKYS